MADSDLSLPVVKIRIENVATDGSTSQSIISPGDLHIVKVLTDLMHVELDEWTIDLEVTTPTGTSIEEVDTDSLLDLIKHFRTLLVSHVPVRPGVVQVVQTSTSLLLLHFVLFEYDYRTDSLDECIGLQRDFLQALPGRSDIHAGIFRELGQCLEIRSQLEEEGIDIALLDEAITWHKEAVRVYHPPDPGERSTFLRSLALALWSRFETQGCVYDDLDIIVSTWNEYTDIVKWDVAAMVNLGSALCARHDLQTKALRDLDDAVTWHRSAYLLTMDGHPDRLIAIRVYVTTLWQRYQKEEDLDDLEQAMVLLQEELDLDEEESSDRAIALNRLGSSLLFHFQKTVKLDSSLDPLEGAVELHQQALNMIPADDNEHSVALSNIGQIYAFRYRLMSKLADLQASLDYQERTLRCRPPGHPRRAITLFYLAQSLTWQADTMGTATVAERAVELIEEAVKLDGSEDVTIIHGTRMVQGSAYCARGKIKEDEADLTKAVDIHRSLLDLSPLGLVDHINAIQSLVTSLWNRFYLFHRQADLNEAITLSCGILDICEPDSPDLWRFYMNLAILHEMRAELFNSIPDFTRATDLHQRAHALCPLGHRFRSAQPSNLALNIHEDFVNLKYPPAHRFNKIISSRRRALEADPQDPNRWLLLKRLGESSLMLFEAERDLSTLQQALKYFRDALHECPSHGYDRAGLICKIGTTICSSIIINPSPEIQRKDLEEAADLYLQVTKMLPSGHPKHTQFVCTYTGYLFLARYLLYSDHGDFLIAAKAVSDILDDRTLSIPDRLRFAQAWLSAAFIGGRPSDACNDAVLNVYDQVMELLPRLAYLGQDLKSRLDAVSLAPRLTGSAALRAITIGSYERAIEYVEHGRSIFWSQALRLRTPLDDLQKRSPMLHKRLAEALNELEHESFWEPQPSPGIEIEERQAKMYQLADEFEALVEETRNTVHGLEDFMRPKRLRQLIAELHHRTVVVLIPAEKHCEALILNSPSGGSAENIKLPGLSVAGIQGLVLAIRKACKVSADFVELERQGRARGGGAAHGGMDELLSRLWKTIVKPILDRLGYKKFSGRQRPRLWWYPTGDTVFLPLHAAGIYRGRTECVSDYVVSSYLPNLSTLAEAQKREPPSDWKLLLLSQPNARKQRQLYNTTAELKRVADLAPPDSLLYLSSTDTLDLEGKNTTSDNVLAVLPNASIVHLACHGFQDQDDPLDSGFEMYADRLTILKLIKLKIPNAFFAFLSACHSASGSDDFPDEAIGLGSAMLFVGFRSVVGTMWSMDDLDGPDIAGAVYKELFSTRTLDAEVIPYALDEAVQKLRRKGAGAARWACYTHIGI